MTQPSRGSYYACAFKMPSLNRSDLSEIEKVILESLHPERYHMACQGFLYNRVCDIPIDSDKAITLVVYTHAPCLRLKLARSWAELYCEDNNSERQDAIERIVNLVKSRERRNLWRFSKLAIWGAPILGFGLLSEVVILVAGGHLSPVMIKPAIGFLLMTFIWWVIAYRVTLYRFSRIHLAN